MTRSFVGVEALGVLLVTFFCFTRCQVDPKPKSLTLPQSEDMRREMRQAMLDFNSNRFDAEVAMIDSAIQALDVPTTTLSGGVRVMVDERGAPPASKPWLASQGDRVVWNWTVRSLDGDSLHSAKEEFTVGQDAVPRSFHEAAPFAGDGDSLQFWSPSMSAFGVRGIPGSVAPFTPVRIQLRQERSASDTTWWKEVCRGSADEARWLTAYLTQTTGGEKRMQINNGVWVSIHSTSNSELQAKDAVLLRLRTSQVRDVRERETAMEWTVGTPDQLVPALEAAFSAHPNVRTMTVWSTSDQAFGTDGAPSAGIDPHRPMRFDVEVVRQ